MGNKLHDIKTNFFSELKNMDVKQISFSVVFFDDDKVTVTTTYVKNNIHIIKGLTGCIDDLNKNFFFLLNREEQKKLS